MVHLSRIAVTSSHRRHIGVRPAAHKYDEGGRVVTSAFPVTSS